MDDVYTINVAKTEFREAYNTGDVERLLAVYGHGFIDMSVGVPSFYGPEAREVLRARMSEFFARYRVRLVVSIITIEVFGNTALDYGWHEMTVTPKDGGDPVLSRQRYFEMWQKGPDGKWRIGLYIDNMDLPPAMPDAKFIMPQTTSQPVQWT